MKPILTLLIAFSSIIAFSQPMFKTLNNPTLTFNEKQAEINTLFQNKTTLTRQDSADLKNYARWSQFWQSRLNTDGTTGYTSAPDVNFQNCISKGNWIAEGPYQFPQNSNGVGRVQSIAVYQQNHQIVYIGSNTGGVFKSTNLGLSWESVFDDSDIRVPGLGVLDIIIHPTNPNIVLIATGLSSPLASRYGAGIYKTVDGGGSWVNVSNWINPSIKYSIVDNLAFAPGNPNIVYATYEDKLLKSTDGGSTFNVYRTNPNGQKFEKLKLINSGSDQLLYTTTKEQNTNSGVLTPQIWRCKLNTNVWTNITTGAMIGHRFFIDVTLAAPNNLYVEYVGKLFISTDQGDNFIMKPTSISGQSPTKNDIAVSATDPNIIFMGGLYTKKSVNAGTSISKSYSHHADLREITYVSSGIGGQNDSVLVGHDGGIHLIVGNSMFNRSSISLNISQSWDCQVMKYGKNTAIIGSQDNGTFLFENDNWIKIRGGDGGSNKFTSFDNNDYLIASANSTISLKNLNGSSGFKIIEPNICSKYGYSGSLCFGVATHTRPFLINTQNPKSFYWGLWDIYRYKLSATNIAATETVITSTLNLAPNIITSMAMSDLDTNVIYFTTQFTQWNNNTFINSSVYKTTNGGVSWTGISPPEISRHGGSVTSIAVNPLNHNQLWVTYGGFYDYAGTPNYQDKIYTSLDGGNSWFNYSEGLQNFPINEIIYEKGSNNRLYIATDLGVFYRDATMNKWECFNEGLPPVVTTGLSINYCTREIFASTYGRGLWSADLLPNQSAILYAGGNGTGEVWNTDRKMTQSIHVSANKTLVLDGININMAVGTQIVVEKGAKLIIKNSTLTNECGGFWGGIQVQSDPAAITQYCNTPNCLVGKVVVTNSTISNAEVGIQSETPGLWAGGGVIQATNTHFLNNRRDIIFAAFENHNVSSGQITFNESKFINCDFEIGTDYQFDVKPPIGQMVSAWQVRGIKFYACNFKNTSGKIIDIVGIYTFNARVEVSGKCNSATVPCTSTTPSTFTKLKSGITAIRSGLNYDFIVDDAEFTDCQYGVISSGVNYATITNNTFNITNDFYYNKPTAILLEYSDMFTVEENTINTVLSYTPAPNIPVPFTGNDRGILVKNAGGGSNSIFKNTFNNINWSNVAYGNNYRTWAPRFGLQYQCNEMNDSKTRDITVYGGDHTGIAGHQGKVGFPADNVFTTGIADSKGHLFNEGTNPISYYYRNNVGGSTYKPVNISSNVNPIDASPVISLDNNCKSHLIQMGDIPKGLVKEGKRFKRATDFDLAITAFNQAKYVYASTIDGGDTYGLLNTVQSNNAQTAWEQRTELINSSPLSIEVIMQTIDEAFLSNALLHDVLMVNPHAVRNEDVMKLLETKPVPMPAYMINTLLGIYEVQTQKDVLEAEMAFQMQQARLASKFMLIGWHADSTNPVNDSLLYVMNQTNTVNSDWAIVAYHLAKGNEEGATTVMDAIPQNFDLDTWTNTNYTELKTYFDNFKTLMPNNGKAIYNPDGAQLATLEQMAADSDRIAGRMAQHQVLWAQGKTYWPVIADEVSNKTEKRDPRAKREETPFNVAKIYPSPAHSFITVEMMALQSDQPVRISMISTTGLEVLSHNATLKNGGVVNLNTQELASGQYFVLIYQGNKVIQKQAIEVVH